MALTSGTKLGPYEIVSPLGAGGIGEGYRDKIVASWIRASIALWPSSVLPAHLSSAPELKQCVELEAVGRGRFQLFTRHG
jgi:hypothetical protein